MAATPQSVSPQHAVPRRTNRHERNRDLHDDYSKPYLPNNNNCAASLHLERIRSCVSKRVHGIPQQLGERIPYSIWRMRACMHTSKGAELVVASEQLAASKTAQTQACRWQREKAPPGKEKNTSWHCSRVIVVYAWRREREQSKGRAGWWWWYRSIDRSLSHHRVNHRAGCCAAHFLVLAESGNHCIVALIGLGSISAPKGTSMPNYYATLFFFFFFHWDQGFGESRGRRGGKVELRIPRPATRLCKMSKIYSGYRPLHGGLLKLWVSYMSGKFGKHLFPRIVLHALLLKVAEIFARLT